VIAVALGCWRQAQHHVDAFAVQAQVVQGNLVGRAKGLAPQPGRHERAQRDAVVLHVHAEHIVDHHAQIPADGP
jgi:hypothetical protein